MLEGPERDDLLETIRARYNKRRKAFEELMDTIPHIYEEQLMHILGEVNYDDLEAVVELIELNEIDEAEELLEALNEREAKGL